jgi:hypothetical protein
MLIIEHTGNGHKAGILWPGAIASFVSFNFIGPGWFFTKLHERTLNFLAISDAKIQICTYNTLFFKTTFFLLKFD